MARGCHLLVAAGMVVEPTLVGLGQLVAVDDDEVLHDLLEIV
jgi:hypothetical protein